MVLAVIVIVLLLLANSQYTSDAEPVLPMPQPPQAKILSRAVEPALFEQQVQHPRVSASPSTTRYEIKAGDTISAIAARYNTTPSTILQQNPAVVPENLKVGNVLQVPVNTVKKQKTREELAQTASKMVITTSGEPSSYVKKVPCTLTAYSLSFESTGKHPGEPGYGVTASGQVAKEGWTVAVDPAVFPLHSVLYIPGIGVRYAEDTGGAVKGDHIDVFYENDAFCHQFGVKPHVNVYVIEEGSRESA